MEFLVCRLEKSTKYRLNISKIMPARLKDVSDM